MFPQTVSTAIAVQKVIAESGLFDREFYLSRNPDVVQLGMDPIEHYVRHGAAEGRDPAPWFQTERYLREHPDIAASGLNPFYLHVLTHDTLPQTGQTAAPRILRQGDWRALYDTPLHVNWSITDMCNYKCSYCFGQKPLDAKNFSSWDDLKRAVAHIATLHRSSYDFCITGGEPTTHPHFLDLLTLIATTFARRLRRILIITNGSNKDSLYERIAGLADSAPIAINMSIHPEFAGVKDIARRIEILASSVRLHFPISVHPEKKTEIAQFVAMFAEQRKKYPFNVSFTTLREAPRFDRVDARYTPEDFAWQKEQETIWKAAVAAGPEYSPKPEAFPPRRFWQVEQNAATHYLKEKEKNESLRDGLVNFKGMYCCPGTTVLRIMADGLARGAICGERIQRANIFTENPYFNDEFISLVQCSQENCGCAANNSICKFRDRQEAEAYITMFREKQRRLLQGC